MRIDDVFELISYLRGVLSTMQSVSLPRAEALSCSLLNLLYCGTSCRFSVFKQHVVR